VLHRLWRPLLWPAIALEPFRIANRYGLFAVIVRGSPAGARAHGALAVPVHRPGGEARHRSVVEAVRDRSVRAGLLRSADGQVRAYEPRPE